MKRHQSIALFSLVLVLASPSFGFAEECTWQNKYRNGGYQRYRDRAPDRRMERPSATRENPRVGYLQAKRTNKTITSSETIELNILESGGSPQKALLAVKKHEGNITLKETVELQALETTGSPRVALLAVKKFDGSITPGETVELEALERSGGNVLFANLALKKFKGQKLTECESQELSYIERSISTGQALPVPAAGTVR